MNPETQHPSPAAPFTITLTHAEADRFWDALNRGAGLCRGRRDSLDHASALDLLAQKIAGAQLMAERHA